MLLDKYGERREDGVRRLYRFPVIFAADAWELLMPHTLQVWAAGKRKFWAEYDDSGVRRCKTYAAVPKDATGRVIRLFGGRKVVDRPDFGARRPGALPALPGAPVQPRCAAAFVHRAGPADSEPDRAAPRSFYSMDGIRQQLLQSSRACVAAGCRATLPGQTFWLTKVYKDDAHRRQRRRGQGRCGLIEPRRRSTWACCRRTSRRSSMPRRRRRRPCSKAGSWRWARPPR
jgi:hypothetical protein